jgi:hypothetical protein
MADRSNTVGIDAGELTADLGQPDVPAMRSIRGVFEQSEPLVERCEFDDVLNPTRLRAEFGDGIADADRCRIDATWYRSGGYSFHYTDSEDVNWRFDRHPNPHSPEAHVHEPPDAKSETAVESCITVAEPVLVARAVLKLWRRAYETGDTGPLNTAENPP